MMDHFTDVQRLSDSSPEEMTWINDRLGELSAKERLALRGALTSTPPKNGAELINLLLRLPDFEICFPAENELELGMFAARYDEACPEKLLQYVDTRELGEEYRADHPGAFVQGAYVVFPTAPPMRLYDGTNLASLDDTAWSVKLKLASDQNPDGVWLRLPDYEEACDGRPDEIKIALSALGVDTIQECTLLDAKCILPEAGNLMAQYDNVADLIYDGNDLGYVLDECGQGMPDFMDRYAAALELEDCHTLAFALDISQNLSCYDYISTDELSDFAVRKLQSSGMSGSLLASGCVDFTAFSDDLLLQRGYLLTRDESGYVARNGQEFICERTAQELPGMVLE